MSPRSQQTIIDLAEEAGAKTCSKSPRRLGRTLLKSRQPQMPAAAGLVICVGENAPRDLDDPFSDPKVQARIGQFIAKYAALSGRRHGRGRRS
jgi:hypothetical protein